MVRMTTEPIDPAKIYDLITTTNAGSVVVHYAVVKPMAGVGGTTSYIDYAANGDTEAELRDMAAGLTAEFALEDALLIRRTGRLRVGDIISLAAVSSPNSGDAFEACKEAISRLKKMNTIVKTEICG
ncbi:molybdenum cofactor biosynthesis protein MoaE [Geobacter sp. FeAm09]|uniref:molybdenum cofactor biosynthesis protein MoaE n=1 Tax=Geobacter sp. FeAm09 TaxID=2597769 RepID=UPI0011F02409|nr:molybdenum cofactor biosynthesis protein MoaE [Geobacter sp. FeAm09]QEM69373.1 molybdenum cofactor biosynthesis protein MoaE [Geobacter sp. FeAm09]